MTEKYDNSKIEHIQNIAYSQFPYDDFYIYKGNNRIINNAATHNEQGYIFRQTYGTDFHTKFKEHDIVYIPGFTHIANPYCDTTCFNIRAFGIISHIFQEDGKIEVLFGKNKGKNVIYLFYPHQIERWLRTTDLDPVFLLSRVLAPKDGMMPDKLAKMLTDKNNAPQHLESHSILYNNDDIDKPPSSISTSSDDDDDIIDPEAMNKAFNRETLQERINNDNNETWRDAPSDIDGGKNNLRKSKKNRKYKNKTIKAGNKNKSYEKQKGGHIDEKKLKDEIYNIAVSNEIGATALDGKDEIQKHHQDIEILFGYKTQNGSECWLGRKKADERAEFDEYFFIQGKNSEKID